MTGILGAVVAAVVAWLLVRMFTQGFGGLDTALTVVGFVGLGGLLVWSYIKRPRGEPSVKQNNLTMIMNGAAILLLFATSLLSGPYLVLVPLVAAVLLVAFIIVTLRSGND